MTNNGGRQRPKRKKISLENGELSYLHWPGNGLPAIFLHGFGGNGATWLYNLSALQPHADLYALDLPGHGDTTGGMDDVSLQGLSDTIADFIDTVPSEKIHLIGHSLGGAIATRYAVDRPSKIASLSLISCACVRPDFNRDFFRAFIVADTIAALESCLEQSVCSPTLRISDMAASTFRWLRGAGSSAALGKIAETAILSETAALAPVAGLSGITGRVQVIWGREDRIAPVAHAQFFPPNVAIHLIDNAGHLPHLEASKDVNRLLVEALTG